MLEQLFHPRVVVGLLEETKKLEVGIAEMAVELGASTRLGDAGIGIPAAGMTVEELIFSNTFSVVVQIDVLQKGGQICALDRKIGIDKSMFKE